MKAVVALGVTALVAGLSFPISAQQAFEAHILIVRSHGAIQNWVLSPPAKRQGDSGRARTIARDVKFFFPVVVTGFDSTGPGRPHFTADLELIAPSGKVAATLKRCCAANVFDPKTPGVVVLNPVIDVTFESDDPAGTYTMRATVSDGSRSATASESFRLPAVPGAKK